MRRRARQSRRWQCFRDGALVFEPRVRQNFVDVGATAGVVAQDFGDQVSGGVGNLNRLRKRVVVHTNTLVCGLYVVSFKGRLANDERIDDDAEGPDVDLVGVALLAF